MSQSISQKFTPITLLKFALPSMVMMIFMSCYTIVDGIFISRYLGSEWRVRTKFWTTIGLRKEPFYVFKRTKGYCTTDISSNGVCN